MDAEIERCEFIHAHEEIVNKVNSEMPDDEILYDLAELFKIFGDSTRIKILYVLFESEMCVCDIAQLLNMDAVGDFTPAACTQAKQACQVPPRGQNRILFAGRRACAHDSRPGNGARCGINFSI